MTGFELQTFLLWVLYLCLKTNKASLNIEMKMSLTNCSGGKFKLKIMNLQSGASSWENSKWRLFNLGVKVSTNKYLQLNSISRKNHYPWIQSNTFNKFTSECHTCTKIRVVVQTIFKKMPRTNERKLRMSLTASWIIHQWIEITR